MTIVFFWKEEGIMHLLESGATSERQRRDQRSRAQRRAAPREKSSEESRGANAQSSRGPEAKTGKVRSEREKEENTSGTPAGATI